MENKNISLSIQNSFVQRFLQYQKERFPFLLQGTLIACFTFSAISYSRISRGMTGFITIPDFVVTAFITITLFFLLRLFDEIKDYEDDVKFRKYLPVARGLISLQEIKRMSTITILLQVIVISLYKSILLPIYALCLFYMLLMRVEFFVPNWLKERQVVYILSHMLIIPLVDIFASAMDWKVNNVAAPIGLTFFFIVSFLNGLVLEIGRKMRSAKNEEFGVVSYTKLWGIKRGPIIWIMILGTTLFSACIAAQYAGYSSIVFYALLIVFFICSIPALLFIKNPTKQYSKQIEYASGVWTICMYLLLGAAPMMVELITH